ncbi:MAG: SAM-dependent methyltransferase [Nanoarchaeota archaeon]
MKPIYIVEHLEPELWPWCLIEYESLSKAVGKDVWFTHVQKKDVRKLSIYGKVFTQSVQKLDLDLRKTCVLEPFAPRTLETKEAKEFDYYIFGGILGDEKLNGRTEKELTRFLKKADKRNIGKEQFSTDNAVYVTNQIVQGIPLKKQTFQDALEIQFNRIESVILPYRYPLVDGKPRISKKLIAYLKKKETF